MALDAKAEKKLWKIVQGMLPCDLEATLNTLEENGYALQQIVKVSKASYIFARLGGTPDAEL